MTRQSAYDGIALVVFIALSLIGGCTHSTDEKDLQAFARRLPDFVLQDPHGKRYKSQDLKETDLIVVITAATMHNKDAQEGWNQVLKPARHKKDVTLIFLEDMSPSSFKGKARDKMAKESKPGLEPILLIDPNGEVRKEFKAPSNETVVLVYKKQGELVHVETKAPGKEGAVRIWQSLNE